MLKSFSALAGGTTGAVNYKGAWNASTNTPALTSSTGTNGDYYVVSVAGSTTLNGISNWGVGDWAVFNGSVWQRVEGGADVNTVNLTVSGNTTLSGPVSVMPTWNAGATTFMGIGLNVTDTASAAGSLLMDLQVGGSSLFKVDKLGALTIPAGASNSVPSLKIGTDVGLYSRTPGSLNFGGIGNWTLEMVSNEGLRMGTSQLGFGASVGSNDLILTRDAANTLAQRNGTNAQAFRVYNTFTDASNFERGKIEWASNVLRIGTEKAGTGTARALELQTDGTTRLTIETGGNAVFTDAMFVGSAAAFAWSGRARITSPSTDNLTLFNFNSTDFGRLNFGGTTSSFPALKRNSTALETKLADDSAYAPHAMQYLDINDGITAPAAATGRARIYVDTADGDLKVIFADGTIKTIATDT